VRSDNTAGRRWCPIVGREAVHVCSATTHTAPARDARGIAVAHTRCQVFRRNTHTCTRKHPPRASTLLADGHGPLGSPSHQPGRRDDGEGDVGKTADCVWPRRRCTTHQKNSKRCVGGRMGEPSRAVRRCKSVCCRPWRCSSIERTIALSARRVRGIPPARALGSIMCIWPGSIVRDDSRCSTLCRALNTQRPRALVLQPKGVMEQSTDMIPPPHAWRHLPVPFPSPAQCPHDGDGCG
jgi:hypothetical protein